MADTDNPIELISDELRATLSTELDRLDREEHAIKETQKPTRDRLEAIEAAREALLEPHGLAIAGCCEFCDKRLFAGELGCADREGVVLCEACSPTYGDMQGAVTRGEYDDEPEDKEAIETEIAAHIAGGGALTDKTVRELDAA